MAQNLTDNWQMAKILTDNWHLYPPPSPIQTLYFRLRYKTNYQHVSVRPRNPFSLGRIVHSLSVLTDNFSTIRYILFSKPSFIDLKWRH